jgi:hypothetical protein
MAMLNKRFSLLFYLKKQQHAKGPQPIYLRITVDGKRIEISIKEPVSRSGGTLVPAGEKEPGWKKHGM